MTRSRTFPRPFLRHPLRTALIAFALTLVGAAAAQETWLEHPLTDVATGEVFTLDDYAGTPLLVETMATWCGNCRRQLTNLSEAHAELEATGADVAYVVISVERGLPDAALAEYAERQGFPFRFAVADDALLGMLADRFGRGVLNPPSTPHVILSASGEISELRTGFSDPAELVALLTAAAD